MIHTSTLSNGATLLVEPMLGVRSAAISVLMRAGNAFDPADMLGRGTMWSEMLLRGAGEHDARAQADLFDRLGASRSCDCGRLLMRVGGALLGDRIIGAIDAIAEMITDPRFDEEATESARELAIQAIDSLADDPQTRAVIGARGRHFAEPLNRSGYGDRDHLRAMTRDALHATWTSDVGPIGAIIGVAGAVEPAEVHDAFDSALAGWSGGGASLDPNGDAVRGYGHEDDDSKQVQILLVHDAPPEGHPDRVYERVLSSVLSGGMSARLFTEVRERRGLCYSVSASYTAERDFGSVSAYVGTTPERAQESLDVLHAELLRIGTAEGAVTSDEFDRAKTGLKSRLVFAGESTSARASAIAGDVARIDRARTLKELGKELDGVTLEALNDYAARRELGSITVHTVGPSALTPPAGMATA